MSHRLPLPLPLIALIAAASVSGCGGSTENVGAATGAASNVGVGNACVMGDEARANFSGYSATEVNVESQSAACETGLCLAYDFEGRVGCPYGGTDCTTTGTPGVPVTVPVAPQLVARPPSRAVYCSCRCDGPAGSGTFCACPSGFDCAPLVAAFGVGDESFAGSYCVKSGTEVTDAATLASGAKCDATSSNYGGR